MAEVHISFDGEGLQRDSGVLILWNRRALQSDRGDRIESLPEIVSRDADKWKSRYTTWVSRVMRDLTTGTLDANGARSAPLTDYWSMTLPSLPAFTLDSMPYAVIRTWALFELLRELGPSRVICSGSNSGVARVIETWCLNNEIPFSCRTERSSDASSIRSTARTWLRNSPSRFINSLVALAYLSVNFFRYGRLYDESPARVEESRIVLFDYSYGLTHDAHSKLFCKSHYWGDLPDHMLDWGIPFSWVHLDIPSAATPRLKDRRALISMINSNSSPQRHSLLQDGHGIRTWWHVLKTYLAIARQGVRVSGHVDWTSGEGSQDLTPIVHRHWVSGSFGVVAAQNAMWIEMTRRVAATFSTAPVALYLMENQPWELALVNSWRNHSTSPIYGVIHSTVRRWDTRFWLPQMLSTVGPTQVLPTGVLVNGPNSLKQLTANGYRDADLRLVEALRYQHTHTEARSTKDARVPGALPTLLVLGEYDTSAFRSQVEVCKRLLDLDSGRDLRIRIRPHPSISVDQANLKEFELVDTSRAIHEDLSEARCALTSSMSSAVVDALLSGVSVISVPDDRYFPGLVVEGSVGLIEATSIDAVYAALATVGQQSPMDTRLLNPSDLFYFGEALARWESAIDEILRSTAAG